MKQKSGVLITGASRGIGRACALLLAGHGFHIFLNSAHHMEALGGSPPGNSLDSRRLLRTLPGGCRQPGQVRKIFATIASSEHTDGGLDILINNAGISHIGLLSDMTDEEWSRLIATNLSSAFYCCREAIPHMVSKKSGKILNVSSMWGRSGASCEAAYSASKAGIQGLTQALAKELAPSNIQVNAIAFGVIDTDMNRMLDAEERRALAEEIPAGYFASPEEAARMICEHPQRTRLHDRTDHRVRRRIPVTRTTVCNTQTLKKFHYAQT